MGIELVGKRNGVRACANLADLVVYGRCGKTIMPQIIAGASQYVLQSTIGAYADEAYTNARKLSGIGIVTGKQIGRAHV